MRLGMGGPRPADRPAQPTVAEAALLVLYTIRRKQTMTLINRPRDGSSQPPSISSTTPAVQRMYSHQQRLRALACSRRGARSASKTSNLRRAFGGEEQEEVGGT
jgi:hypothetical protein